jgi:hypothetical protein
LPNRFSRRRRNFAFVERAVHFGNELALFRR